MGPCGILCRLLAVDTDDTGVSAASDVTSMIALVLDTRL